MIAEPNRERRKHLLPCKVSANEKPGFCFLQFVNFPSLHKGVLLPLLCVHLAHTMVANPEFQFSTGPQINLFLLEKNLGNNSKLHLKLLVFDFVCVC